MENQQNLGIPFLKRLLKKIDLHESISSIEDRFLPDGDKALLLMVIDSLGKGKRVQIQKIKAVVKEKA